MPTKQRYQKDKEKHLAQAKKSYDKNKDKYIKHYVMKQKNRYRDNSVYREKEKIRNLTRYHFNKSICQNCGSNNNLEFHHLDYSFLPLSIIVLCRKCHRRLH